MQSANGKLAVLSVGLGAVTTTFITGTLMYRKGLTVPGGSVIEMAKIRVGRGKEKAYKKIKDIVPVAPMDSLEFAAWDIFEENAYLAAVHADVLKQKDIDPVREELEAIKPMKAAFDKNFVTRLQGDHVKQGTRWELVEQLRADIRNFKAERGCNRAVVIWAASTEK
jgi:myo-inositol-1-phosphate synthase